MKKCPQNIGGVIVRKDFGDKTLVDD